MTEYYRVTRLGYDTIVENDESAFGKQKHNRGRAAKTRWIFGAVERVTSKCIIYYMCTLD